MYEAGLSISICLVNSIVGSIYMQKKECAENANKAKELEENLAFYKESYKSGYESAKANARAIGARLTNYSESWSIDSTGNVVMQASTTVVSDTKGWRKWKEERDERIKEKRQEKLDRTKEDSTAYTTEEIIEKDMVPEDAVLIQKERLDDAYYPKFDRNI